MADTILTIQEINSFFWSLTVQMLGLDPAAPANQDRVRKAWPVKGSPTWKIDDNVAFLLVNYDDDSITRQVDVSYINVGTDTADRVMSYTRVLRINWICYGPNSFNDMDLIRSSLFLPKFTQLLAASNLALITEVPVPMRSPELFNGQWWERTSFYARFNELVVRHSSVLYLKSADVQIKKG
jgi:hypothetical protein